MTHGDGSSAAFAAGDGGRRAFLLRVAELLHAYGTPAHRLELVLSKLSRSLGIEAAYLATPTAVVVSFGRGDHQTTHLVRADPGEVNLGKLVEFDEVMEDVEHGRDTPAHAVERLEAVAAAPARYGVPAKAAAWGLASAGAAVFFGGGAGEVLASFAIGAVVSLLERVLRRRSAAAGAFEPVAAFLAAALALASTRLLGLGDQRLVTLASLIVLVPGLTLTIGFTELAARHLVAGMARIAGAGAVFLTMLLGVALAWRLGDALLGPVLASGARHPLPGWCEWAALALVPVGFAVLFETRLREMPVVYVTGVLGYLAARAGDHVLGHELAPFLGALVVGLGSNIYARVFNRPALVPMTPGVLLLVPGSLGFLSLTSFLDRDAVVGLVGAFQTGLVAASLVGGLLVANLLLPPRRVL